VACGAVRILGNHVRCGASRLAVDFTAWEKDNAKFESQFERVVKAFRADRAARKKVPSAKL